MSSLHEEHKERKKEQNQMTPRGKQNATFFVWALCLSLGLFLLFGAIACFVRVFKMVLCVCILHVYDSSRSLLPFLYTCISVYYCSVSLLFLLRSNCYLFAYVYSSGAALLMTLLSVPLPSSS